MGERSKLSPGQLAEIGARNQAHFEREVKLLLPAVRKALFGYLAALRRRMDQSAFGLTAPAPALVAAGPIAQPAGPEQHGFTQTDAQTLQTVFESAAPEWDAAMQNTLMPGIKAMLGRIPLPTDDQAVITAAGAWRSEWLTERTQELKGVPDGIASQIRTELDRLATENGTNVFEAKNAVRSLLAPERMDWEAQRIARTETTMANNSSMLASWRALVGGMGGGLSAKKTWIGGQRPTHSAVSGTTIGINEKFQVGDSEMDGPGDPAGGPGEVCNCVVGSTRVEMPGLRAVTRRWFEGEVLTLGTAAGHELTVTPNHPVLRSDGRWVAARLIREGDHLISGTLLGQSTAAPDVDGRPPQIAEVYRAAALAQVPKRVRGSAPDFHGDGAEGHVEVVPVDGGLLVRGDAASDEQVQQFGLALADLASATVGGVQGRQVPAPISAGVDGPGVGSSAGSVGGGRVSAAFSGGCADRPDSLRVASSARFDSGLDQPTANHRAADPERGGQGEFRFASLVPGGQRVGVNDDAAVAGTVLSGPYGVAGEQHPTDGGHANPQRFSKLVGGFTGLVAPDQVILVKRDPFSGHVYNLDTGKGWYIGNSLAQANCACSLGFELDDTAPGMSDPAGDLGDAEDSEAAAEAGGEPAPGGDPGSFDYATAADEDLSRMLSDAGETGDETAMNRILDELDRRDAATRMAEDAKTSTSLDPAEAEKDARYTQLINEGVDAERAFADAYGGKVEQNKVKEKIQALRAAGYQGKGWHQLTQAVFKEEADRMYWLAQSMDETKGVMLNKAGKQAGIDAKSLFTGPESRARKYASDELLGFWAKYTRITVEDVRAGILGGAMRSAATAAWI